MKSCSIAVYITVVVKWTAAFHKTIKIHDWDTHYRRSEGTYADGSLTIGKQVQCSVPDKRWTNLCLWSNSMKAENQRDSFAALCLEIELASSKHACLVYWWYCACICALEALWTCLLDLNGRCIDAQNLKWNKLINFVTFQKRKSV